MQGVEEHHHAEAAADDAPSRTSAARSSPSRAAPSTSCEKTGESKKHLWETGKAYWLDKDLPNTQHADVNNGTEPIEVIVVELQHER